MAEGTAVREDVECGGLGLLALHVGDHAEGLHAVENVGAAPEGAGQVAVGAEARRRLGESGEKGRLGEVEPGRRPAEPDLRRRLDADEVRAEGRAVEVLRENLLLRHRALKAEGLEGLENLVQERALVRLDEAHRLHRDRRGAGDAAESRDVLPQGAEDGLDADAAMREEAGVLRGDDRLHDPVVAAGGVGRAAVDVVRAEADAYDLARRVAHDEALGEDARLLQRGRIADP